MKTALIKLRLGINMAVIHFALGVPPCALLAQGSLTPPGAPAPTMKTLAQIEPRTPISAVPFTISVPGSYYLTTNVTTAVSNAIIITANGVTLDLNGFTIASTVASAAQGGSGILLAGGRRNVTIQNGFIQGGVTNNGSGTYSGSGFAYGIYYSSGVPFNTRVSGVSVMGCLTHGIYLNTADSTVVESCTVRTAGNFGITGSTIKNSVAVDIGTFAISGDQLSDCRGESTGIGNGINAVMALNCYGSSVDGYGLSATTAAQNCYGISASSYGVSATVAQNCQGISTSGYGIASVTAQNCYGTSSSGYGLHASRSANACYGFSNTGVGLSAYNASFCTGSQSGGTAIQATIATGCIAYSGTNIITYKYNMP